MTRDSRLLPVFVVSGFLGSGKTTLIRGLLANSRLGEVAIIVNEFGEAGLDHYLLSKTDERTVLLSNGCICCGMRGDLSEALRDLLNKRDRREIPPFERVVVETTGLADPVPILHTIVSEPVIHNHFRIEHLVSTIDAVNGLTNLTAYGEAIRQIAAADTAVVTKQDLASADTVSELKARLRRINPLVSLLDGSFGAVNCAALFDSELHRVGATGRRQAASSDLGEPIHGPGSPISSRCIVVERPLNWPMFGIWLTMLLHRHGQRILRFKGLLNVGDGRGPLVLQGVQHVIHAPRHLKEWPDDDRHSRIVVIARDLDLQRVEESLYLFQHLAVSS